MLSTFLRTYPSAQPAPGPAYWLPFRNEEVLVQEQGEKVALIHGDEEVRSLFEPGDALNALYIGMLEGTPCMTLEVGTEFSLPQGWRPLTLRGLYGRLEEPGYSLVGYAYQLLHWQHISRYCPVCGHLNESEKGTWGKHCPHCGHTGYPPATPAILALIHDGDRVLLTHKPGWGKRYSCVAGFVEPGESLEDCVKREVYEEVGVEVSHVAYVGSQPWPFPHQLMVGFTARYVGGTLHIDEQELDDARWFSINALPEMPPPLSLAHYIITTWVASYNHEDR